MSLASRSALFSEVVFQCHIQTTKPRHGYWLCRRGIWCIQIMTGTYKVKWEGFWSNSNVLSLYSSSRIWDGMKLIKGTRRDQNRENRHPSQHKHPAGYRQEFRSKFQMLTSCKQCLFNKAHMPLLLPRHYHNGPSLSQRYPSKRQKVLLGPTWS